MNAEAIEELGKASRLAGDGPVYLSSLGHAFAASGDSASAMKIVDSLLETAKHRYVPSYEIAIVYAGLGDQDQALHWLNNAYTTRDSGWLADVNVDPRLDPLHSEPRFQALLGAMNLATS